MRSHFLHMGNRLKAPHAKMIATFTRAPQPATCVAGESIEDGKADRSIDRRHTGLSFESFAGTKCCLMISIEEAIKRHLSDDLP